MASAVPRNPRAAQAFERVGTQCAQAFDNIEAALRQAGADLGDVVRVTYILPNRDDFPLCWPTLQQRLGSVRPAATMLIAGLADPRMLIEIEVTAKRRSRRVV